MLSPGTAAPDFTVPNQDDQPVQLSAALRSGPLILYFYPADFTPGCTREACGIRDLHRDLTSTGLRVFGISPQSTESHRRFRDKYQLPFDLLSDTDKAVTRAYDSDGPLGLGVRRTTYLINRAGQVESGVLANFRVSEHLKFIAHAADLAKKSRK